MVEERTPTGRQLMVELLKSSHMQREEASDFRKEIRARDDRQDERISHHEERLITVERAMDDVAKRSDIEGLRAALLEGSKDDIRAVRDISSIRDRVGKLEGAKSSENGRHTSRGAVGGVTVTVVVAALLALAKVFGVEVPLP